MCLFIAAVHAGGGSTPDEAAMDGQSIQPSAPDMTEQLPAAGVTGQATNPAAVGMSGQTAAAAPAVPLQGPQFPTDTQENWAHPPANPVPLLLPRSLLCLFIGVFTVSRTGCLPVPRSAPE